MNVNSVLKHCEEKVPLEPEQLKYIKHKTDQTEAPHNKTLENKNKTQMRKLKQAKATNKH